MEFYRFYFTDRAFAIVETLKSAAAELGCTPAQLALAWQLHQPEVTSVIIGVRNQEQLGDNLGARGVTIPPTVMEKLDEASAIPLEYPGSFIAMIQHWLGNA
jgi:aryl-alcohol dehydrogenase-like predicted oxidoreductase